jgi:8-oxo-dGTP pyrophosphatase MutT (NUDIX family)
MGEYMPNRDNESIIAQGKIFELVNIEQNDGRIFEVARRAPGVRLIIFDKENQKLLLTKEFRKELGDWDYRLPGGKVFDSLDDYETHRSSGDDIIDAAKIQAVAEARQEAGIEVASLELYKKSVLGATVEWDLYVFEATEWQKSEAGQELEDGEDIEADTWVSLDEAKRMILGGKMQEERIALILLQWISRNE